jgi:adenylate cyclase class 2
MSARPSYIETEVKLSYPGGAEAARAMIEKGGYQQTEPRILESDHLFDRGDGDLRRSGQLLRLRQSGARFTVTYKGPGQSQRHKSREEIEFDVSDAPAFTEVLTRLGYTLRFRYEKYRAKFAAAGEPGFITIDETPIGVFLELEGTADWIDRTAPRLGFTAADYVISSYASLYRQYRLTHENAPEDMVFLTRG